MPGPALSFPFPTAHNTVNTNILTRGSLIVYTAPDTAILKKSNYTAHFDNFAIQTRQDQNEAKGKMSLPRS
jgi:hypothetical protein